MGRHFESMDAGYSCYSGFLHMEAMHTNPIIICFCSILYYKGLSEHLKRYRQQRHELLASGDLDNASIKIYPSKFTGQLSGTGSERPTGSGHLTSDVEKAASSNRLLKRNYKTRVVIRWHLYLRMTLNKEIIKYRKIYMKQREKKPEVGILQKIKQKFSKCCAGTQKDTVF